MPTVLREAGFEVRIYTLDHPPPHVHVWKSGAVVKIDLATHEATEVVGEISDRDIRRAERLGDRKFGAASTRVDEASWQLIFQPDVVSDTRARVRAAWRG